MHAVKPITKNIKDYKKFSCKITFYKHWVHRAKRIIKKSKNKMKQKTDWECLKENVYLLGVRHLELAHQQPRENCKLSSFERELIVLLGTIYSTS